MCRRSSTTGGRTRGRTWPNGTALHDGDYVCGGLDDGSIRVWSRSTLALERTLTGHTDIVWALMFAGGRLISGSSDFSIRVWDVATGGCEGVLEGHTKWVSALAATGCWLVSGCYTKTDSHEDGAVRVWRMEGEASTWRCERTLDEQRSSVSCLLAWEGRVASGSQDGGIQVWGAETWGLERTLRGHGHVVPALVASGRRLISASEDRTVRVWSTVTWECEQTVEAYAAGSQQFIEALAVSGSALVGGSDSFPHSASEAYEVRVWDLETMEPLHTLKQPAGRDVCWLVRDGGEVWGAGGKQVVVWGRGVSR